MKIVIGLLIAVAFVIGGILALPFLIDLNRYQDQYKPLIEDALNRKVQLQDIRLTIWPRIGARVGGFTVMDDPAFGSSSFASLTSLEVGVKFMPLLSGQVEVEEITLRDPVITVIKNKAGVLNVSTIGRKGTKLPTTPSKAPIPSTEGPAQNPGPIGCGSSLHRRRDTELSGPVSCQTDRIYHAGYGGPPPISSARPNPNPPCRHARATVEFTCEARWHLWPLERIHRYRCNQSPTRSGENRFHHHRKNGRA